METVAKKYPKLVVRFFVNLESSFSAKEKTTITEKALNNKHTLSLFYQFLQTMMPISIRRKGLFNDLSQYKTISNLILEKIQTPTLVIFGKYDADAKPENAFNIKKHMPHAELYEISDGFHFYWFSDHYNEIVEKKISFLKKHSS